MEDGMQASLFGRRALNIHLLYENVWRVQAATLAIIAADYLVQYVACPIAILTHVLVAIGAAGAMIGLDRVYRESLPSYAVSHVGPYAVYGYLQAAWLFVSAGYLIHIGVLISRFH
jgi:hypothetical protein